MLAKLKFQFDVLDFDHSGKLDGKDIEELELACEQAELLNGGDGEEDEEPERFGWEWLLWFARELGILKKLPKSKEAERLSGAEGAAPLLGQHGKARSHLERDVDEEARIKQGGSFKKNGSNSRGPGHIDPAPLPRPTTFTAKIAPAEGDAPSLASDFPPPLEDLIKTIEVDPDQAMNYLLRMLAEKQAAAKGPVAAAENALAMARTKKLEVEAARTTAMKSQEARLISRANAEVKATELELRSAEHNLAAEKKTLKGTEASAITKAEQSMQVWLVHLTKTISKANPPSASDPNHMSWDKVQAEAQRQLVQRAFENRLQVAKDFLEMTEHGRLMKTYVATSEEFLERKKTELGKAIASQFADTLDNCAFKAIEAKNELTSTMRASSHAREEAHNFARMAAEKSAVADAAEEDVVRAKTRAREMAAQASAAQVYWEEQVEQQGLTELERSVKTAKERLKLAEKGAAQAAEEAELAERIHQIISTTLGPNA